MSHCRNGYSHPKYILPRTYTLHIKHLVLQKTTKEALGLHACTHKVARVLWPRLVIDSPNRVCGSVEQTCWERNENFETRGSSWQHVGINPGDKTTSSPSNIVQHHVWHFHVRIKLVRDVALLTCQLLMRDMHHDEILIVIVTMQSTSWCIIKQLWITANLNIEDSCTGLICQQSLPWQMSCKSKLAHHQETWVSNTPGDWPK